MMMQQLTQYIYRWNVLKYDEVPVNAILNSIPLVFPQELELHHQSYIVSNKCSEVIRMKVYPCLLRSILF